jgi:hypothetical protein
MKVEHYGTRRAYTITLRDYCKFKVSSVGGPVEVEKDSCIKETMYFNNANDAGEFARGLLEALAMLAEDSKNR